MHHRRTGNGLAVLGREGGNATAAARAARALRVGAPRRPEVQPRTERLPDLRVRGRALLPQRAAAAALLALQKTPLGLLQPALGADVLLSGTNEHVGRSPELLAAIRDMEEACLKGNSDWGGEEGRAGRWPSEMGSRPAGAAPWPAWPSSELELLCVPWLAASSP